MKKHFILFTIIIYLFTINIISLRSQDVGQIWSCHTIPQTKSSISISVDREVVNENTKIVNIYIHILRKNDGSGGLSEQQVNNTIARLRDDYRQHNIVFNELGRSNINNTSLYNGITQFNYLTLINTNRQNNAINIYLLSPDDDYSRTEDIPGKALSIGGCYI